jgi:hypothetical protein
MNQPPPLRKLSDEAARVLQALPQTPPARVELTYQRLRKLKAKRSRRTAMVTAAAVTLCACLLLGLMPSRLLIRPEVVVAQRAPTKALSVEQQVLSEVLRDVSVAEDSSPQEDPRAVDRQGKRSAAPRSADPRSVVARNVAQRSAVSGGAVSGSAASAVPDAGQRLSSPEASERASSSDLSACARFTRAGFLEEASQCYADAALGSGTSAELAWIEHARLWLRAKGDLGRVEALLKEYFARFPAGALLPEAKLMQIHLLAEEGRQGELLVEIERVTEQRLLPERRVDLEALKALTLAQLGRCDEAKVVIAEANDVQRPELARAKSICSSTF